MSLIRRLKEYGFVIAIDDFGSGYSSLSFLKDIQADILKIDMDFLRKTEHQERSRIILRSIVALARELGMPTVVEGVETLQQVEDLTKLGCNIFQGVYFAQPVPVAAYLERFGEEKEGRGRSGIVNTSAYFHGRRVYIKEDFILRSDRDAGFAGRGR